MTASFPLTSLAQKFSGEDLPLIKDGKITEFRNEMKEQFVSLYTSKHSPINEQDSETACETLIANFDLIKQESLIILGHVPGPKQKIDTELSIAKNPLIVRLNLICDAMEDIVWCKNGYKNERILDAFEDRYCSFMGP